MCGLFGAVGRQIDIRLLESLGERAERRGPHSWGMAWRAPKGNIVRISESRAFSRRRARTALIGVTPGIHAIIGHCRLSTSGTAQEDRNNQPIVTPPAYRSVSWGAAVAHNGNVYRHRELAALYKVQLHTDCDSELLAELLDLPGVHRNAIMLKPPLAAVIGAIGSTPYALLAMRNDMVIVARRAQPLYAKLVPDPLHRGGDTFYFCSVPFEGAKLLADGTATIYPVGDVEMPEDLKARPPEHPIGNVRWVEPSILKANGYNPNKVFPPELALLKLSIMEDGWTQPIVARPDGEIIDGFHRWSLGMYDSDVRRVSGGLVPVVFVEPKDVEHQMAATVRHNRARGQHAVLKMGEIVRMMRANGLSDEEIQKQLGMEDEELDRLADLRGSPELAGKDSFGKGWVPTLPEGESAEGAHVKLREDRKKKRGAGSRAVNKPNGAE